MLPRMSKWWLPSVVLIVIALGGCSANTAKPPRAHEAVYFYKGPSPAADTRHIKVAPVAGLGRVLVDGDGEPFYTFSSDRLGVGECVTGPCSVSWPLFRLTRFLTLDYSALLEGSDIKVEFDSEGSRFARYKGQALHTYVGDTFPGRAKGQGLVAGGGHWHVIPFRPNR
jgi:predicted lipoprotein with Yx(FWY)xxD motif